MIINSVTPAAALALYQAVGWTAYTKDPARVAAAIAGSSFIAATHRGSELVGLARAISDDATICFLQDVLVAPAWQRRGIGRGLVKAVLERYAHVPRTVLLTDPTPELAAFYSSLGFTSTPQLRSFVRVLP